MATMRIAATAVEAMKPGDVIWDSQVKGFGIRRRKVDRVYLVKTRISGRQQILTIGRHGRGYWGPESARREAIRLLGLIQNGEDPAAEKRQARNAETLGEFSARYMTEYAEARKKPRTRQEDERLLKLHILPSLGAYKIAAITDTDVTRLHVAMQKTPVAANRAVATLSSIMSWAEKTGERPRGTNPCRFVDRYVEKPKERLLSSEEIARLGEALVAAESDWTGEKKAAWTKRCENQADALLLQGQERKTWLNNRMPQRHTAEDWRAVAFVRLLLLTGARRSEVLGLEWQWIEDAVGRANLPDSKTGPKFLYLASPVMDLLQTLPRDPTSPCILPGDRPGAKFVGVQKPWQRIRALAALPDVRLHDLRHAFASTAVAAGDSLYLVGKVLGHRQATTTERYAHLAPNPIKSVADRTAARLVSLLDTNTGREKEPSGTSDPVSAEDRKHSSV